VSVSSACGEKGKGRRKGIHSSLLGGERGRTKPQIRASSRTEKKKEGAESGEKDLASASHPGMNYGKRIDHQSWKRGGGEGEERGGGSLAAVG